MTAAIVALFVANDLGMALGRAPDRRAVRAPLFLVISNTVGNVPTVVLLVTSWPDPSPGAFFRLALHAAPNFEERAVSRKCPGLSSRPAGARA